MTINTGSQPTELCWYPGTFLRRQVNGTDTRQLRWLRIRPDGVLFSMVDGKREIQCALSTSAMDNLDQQRAIGSAVVASRRRAKASLSSVRKVSGATFTIRQNDRIRVARDVVARAARYRGRPTNLSNLPDLTSRASNIQNAKRGDRMSQKERPLSARRARSPPER